jgi:hypothetical protein
VPLFIEKSRDIYRYQHFICDSGGSLCEVVNLSDGGDPVLNCLADHTLLLYIRGTPAHARKLVDRFRLAPKPMYYQPQFLDQKWAEFKALNGIKADDDVDPDAFAVWGFEQLLHHRIPLYEAIARKYGYAVEMEDIPAIHDEAGFVDLVCRAIEGRTR